MQKMIRKFYLILLCVIVISGCLKKTEINKITVDEDPIIPVDPLRTHAGEIASSMDDRLLAAQILISGTDGRGFLPPHMTELFAEYPTGAVMLFKYNLDTDNDSIRTLLSQTSDFIAKQSGIPPFIAVDHEGGTVNRFLPGVASLPSAITYWDLALSQGSYQTLVKIEADSLRAGNEIHDLGINMNFAPIAELLNNDNRDFMARRSYGSSKFFTTEAASSFVRGMDQAGVLSVIKHFPGSAGFDPHYSVSVINGDKAALNSLVSPFASLINRGARAIMIAHTAVPALDNKIASLSPVVMNEWLRGDLGFDGIIICDDFIMAAAGEAPSEEAAVLSIAAGSDMILVWPSDLRRTHRAFMTALEDGRLSRERLREAASRVIYEKMRMGLMDKEN
jgi:beta-N-acetylhexosaminidase